MARPVSIKIGSSAPKGSPWDEALRRIAAEWSEISDGDIRIKIYPGGIAGNEKDMIRKMRFNQLQGAVLTSMGLNRVDSDTVALSIPFLITSNAEYEYVFERVSPTLSEGLKEEGYTVVAWTQAGWIHFFSKRKIVYPEDLKRMKLGANDTDPNMFRAWKELGYDVINLPLNEIGTALSSGMVEVVYNVLIGATAFQIYNFVDYMMNFPISPVIGGFIVSNRTWSQIDDDIKPELLQAAEEAADELYYKMQELEEESLQVLKKKGVEIVDVPPEAKEKWRQEFEKGFGMLVGKSFSQEIFDMIKKYVEEFRQ
jgi:TRAP-type C4-dicarboxylate transport system substrate-binding protein